MLPPFHWISERIRILVNSILTCTTSRISKSTDGLQFFTLKRLIRISEVSHTMSSRWVPPSLNDSLPLSKWPNQQNRTALDSSVIVGSGINLCHSRFPRHVRLSNLTLQERLR